MKIKEPVISVNNSQTLVSAQKFVLNSNTCNSKKFSSVLNPTVIWANVVYLGVIQVMMM